MTKYVRDPTNLCVNDSDTIILGLHPPLRFVINRSALVERKMDHRDMQQIDSG